MKFACTVVAFVSALAGLATAQSADAAPYCRGGYAEDLSSLSPAARDLEARTPPYSYAVRTSAIYECVSYGGDGNLKKTRVPTMGYGTAFGLRSDGADTLLVTNHHVAEWPAVTDDDHPVEGVPAGCKRISDSLKIVDDDHDEYADDDVPLTRVVTDPQFDVAVLRAHAKLQVLPWRIGRSASLGTRDAVEVKGFPLGEFRATNVGKVVSAYEHDSDGAWNHDDFVVDALLTIGGSGSPVLAISCDTGEFELVGIFHAHYSAGSALNVVIAIDQLRDLLTTLKPPPRPKGDPSIDLDGAARARLAEELQRDHDPPFFAAGSLTASVRARANGTLVFALFSGDFPRSTAPLLAIEDSPATDRKAFGQLGSVYVATPLGLQRYAADDAESQAGLARMLALLRIDAISEFDYRSAMRVTAASRSASDRAAAKKRSWSRLLETQHDAVQAITDMTSRAAASASGEIVSLAELEAGPVAHHESPAATVLPVAGASTSLTPK